MHAVTAPFKSKTKLGFVKAVEGPGPAAHFKMKMEERDLLRKLKPGLITFPPENVPFETSQRRFANQEEFEEIYRPSPCDYDIIGFTDEMADKLKRHAAAIPNSKLGFGSTAEARPVKSDLGDINIVSKESCHCLCEPERKWRNLRPRRGLTYSYFGPPPKFPDSPGPIYDTAPSCSAVKGKKSWWDPRGYCETGFLNSGCERKTGVAVDKDIPGPGKYYSRLPRCQREPGRQSCFLPRFKESVSIGPGPTHKLHEMYDSSVWKASHLGTFNSYLKHVGVLFPWAGGFRKKNLNQAGDEAWHITRPDDYETSLCPTRIAKTSGAKVTQPATVTEAPCGTKWSCGEKTAENPKVAKRGKSSKQDKGKQKDKNGTKKKPQTAL